MNDLPGGFQVTTFSRPVNPKYKPRTGPKYTLVPNGSFVHSDGATPFEESRYETSKLVDHQESVFLGGHQTRGKHGVMIAGNSGLPGGDYAFSGPKLGPNGKSVYNTQEEDILSRVHDATAGQQKSYALQDIMKYGMPYGMLHPHPGSSEEYHTIQGINYGIATPEHYAQAWVLENPFHPMLIGQTSAPVSLVFCAAPNINDKLDGQGLRIRRSQSTGRGRGGGRGSGHGRGRGQGRGQRPINTMRRTCNYEMRAAIESDIENMYLFRLGVQNALCAALDAMIYTGVTHAYVARLGTGVYSKLTNDGNSLYGDQTFKEDLTAVLNARPDIKREGSRYLDSKQGARRDCFAKVYLSMYGATQPGAGAATGGGGAGAGGGGGGAGPGSFVHRLRM